MSADLAAQKALRARLTLSTDVTELVAAPSILDVNQRPAPMPSIIIGEGQTLERDRIDRSDLTIIFDLHVWNKEAGLAGVRAIAGAIRKAIREGRLPNTDGFQFGDCHVLTSRFMRDPDGETAHGIVTVQILSSEVAP